MKKRLLVLTSLILALALSACAVFARESTQPPEGSCALYFAVADERLGGAAVDCEYWLPEEGTDLIPALVDLLLAGPEDPRLASPFPAGVRLRSWEWEEGGGVHLDMNESYSALSSIDLTVADYCLALTLCQLEEVEYVHITVMGEELPFWRADALRERDVILSGAEEQPVVVSAALYYPRSGGEGLSVEYRDVLVTEGDILAGAVMDAYLEGPAYQSLRPCVPEGTALRSVTMEGGICYVNFSAEFLAGAPAGEEARLLVYSIVNTVGVLEKVEAVQLQVEGENLSEYGGLPVTALRPDFSLEQNAAQQGSAPPA